MTRIKTTHVGSLPRSQEVVDFIFAREHGKTYDQAAFDKCLEAAVTETVARQVEAGVDIVSDGENSKISYATYVKDRYSGFSGDSPRNVPADLKLFPGLLKKLAESGGTPTYSRPQCTGPVKSLGQDELLRDITHLKEAMKIQGISHGFMNSASPGVISLFMPNAYYPSRESYLTALAEELKKEYRTIADAGLDLQIDCPDLALSRHMLFSDLSPSEFVKIAELHMDVLNGALAGIDPARIRLHVCWGNYEGPHICDISMDAIFSTLMKSRARYILFEASNPRHAHEWKVFQDRKGEIPDDKVLVPGVVDSTTNFVEHPELVAQRLTNFINVVGPDRVVAGTDCGFGTFAGYGAVDADIAFAKLRALSEGAALWSLQ